ncbi:PREDICTED: uncharacterized protein LOC109589760 [Amphimedon queenslandica]|uniref:Uncharacterized protein n=2 Tax=Amphimedon queenslandica TaxID=400682 RepID=A0AAN0JWQ2_AMPQE|nr:PREDICTED: uncharacterized protein LOC109589760 [Amphimedon queenslandica]|eukprot:XP_019861342.1 PREDICTED: uncharacterized protein LOC109589760 [Amphimedon queenslandica]
MPNSCCTCTCVRKFVTKWIFPIFFTLMSAVTFQWIRPRRELSISRDNVLWVQSHIESIPIIFEFICCLLSIIMICIVIPALSINIFPLVMYIIGWATCSYDYSSICYTLYFNYNETTNENELPQLALRDIKPENNVDNKTTKPLIQEFVDLSKISLLFSTTANAVSQVLFVWALWCLYIKHFKSFNECLLGILKFFKKKCCGVESGNKDKLPLDPFNDETKESDLMETDPIKALYNQKIKEYVNFFSTEDERTNTPLHGERLCHYVTWFIIGFTLLATTAGVFFWLYCEQNKGRSTNDTYNLERAALALYTYSLFRVLVSCFIFSKLMYGIQRRCEELELFVYHIYKVYNPKNNNLPVSIETYVEAVRKHEIELGNITNDNSTKSAACIYYLKERDRHFVNTAVSTLSWLQLWFLLHWILHIISTFMIASLLIDAIALHVKSRISHIEHGVGFHPGEIGFLFMYSVLECFFLLHPCLRAASVTRTRQRVIRKISEKASKEYKDIEDILTKFIESMKRRKFSFRLRILCASIPFNLNIAYVSIAFAFISVIVTLITTVTK